MELPSNQHEETVMSAMVETRHRAECFDCGWLGEETLFFDDADDEAKAHNAEEHWRGDSHDS